MIHDNESSRSSIERRHRNLTDADIQELVNQINNAKHLNCRFNNITNGDLEEAVKFYKNFNSFMEDSKSTIWKAILVLGVGGTITLLILGFISKVKSNLSI